MRAWLLGLIGLCTALGCGESDDDGDDGNGGNAGSSAGQSVSGGGASAGKGGVSVGGSGAGVPHGGATGNAGAGSNTGGNSAGTAAGGGEPGEAGAPAGGGATGLSECNPTEVTCKAFPPECPTNQVPSVDGTCWGECVKIEQCACTMADDCPNPNEYTCWMQQHCGPYVK
jgi:hypothetical protein